ncbi:MAG: nuclear transport factor 2 family protein [Burkholderiaceae bacterium]
MKDIALTVERYLSAWNEPEGEKRRALVASFLAEDGCYRDPLMEADGIDNISAMIGAAQKSFPGHLFTLSGPIDRHHQFVRFRWDAAQAGAESTASGTDVCVLNGRGQFQEVIGFLDKFPKAQ